MGGNFNTEKEAAKRYDQLALFYHGHTNGLLTETETALALTTNFRVAQKKRSLPRFVYRQGKRFRVAITNLEGVHIEYGCFPTLGEAKAKADAVEQAQTAERERRHLATPIERNANGQAIVVTSRRTKEAHAVLVDEKWWHTISRYNWTWCKKTYPVGRVGGKTVYLHHFVYQLAGGKIPPGYVIDHIDHDRANVRQNNLRVLTRAENSHSKRKRDGCKSRFPGVSKCGNSWFAQSKKKRLGSFATEEAAAEASRAAALQNYPGCYVGIPSQ
jgi:hypothetical protein